MQVLQKLSLRLYRRGSKTDKEGYAPIYCKVTIDGVEDVLSSGIKVKIDDWDKDTKTVFPTEAEHKNYNKRLRQLITDLERHFDLVTAKNGIALPAAVIESYQTPVNGAKMREERQANVALSEEVDKLTPSIIQYFTLLERAENHRMGHNLDHIRQRLERQKAELNQRLEKLVKTANKIFDDKTWAKTFMLALDESLVHFLQQVMAGKCSHNTLKKKWNTKNRWSEFLNTRYSVSDLHLNQLEPKILDAFVLNEQTVYNLYGNYRRLFNNDPVNYQNPGGNLIGKKFAKARKQFERLQKHPIVKNLADVYDLYTYFSKYEHFGIMTYDMLRLPDHNNFFSMVEAIRSVALGMASTFMFLQIDLSSNEYSEFYAVLQEYDKLINELYEK